MFEATPIVWHNGKIVPREQADPSIASHSLHLGIGVFDGITAYWNGDHYYIHRLIQHLERLHNGSNKIGLYYSWSIETLAAGIEELLEQLPPTTYYIRPIIYRSQPNIFITNDIADVTILAVTVPRDVNKSLSCQISTFERVSSRAIPIEWKLCGTYINSYLARTTSQAAGFDDGIMLNQAGNIAEASAANLLFLHQGSIITPSLDSDVFPGITRYTLFDIAHDLGIPVIERTIQPNELACFEGAFLASTMMELKPIHNIQNYQYQTANNQLFKRILAVFREITHQ
ncbi:MAG: aminotransferase class IV [Nostoc sp.]|uniref:aminotransferase class IV n=1 Tax=Nostoc sp. TaxID=1180 RepID=UPI002FF5678C